MKILITIILTSFLVSCSTLPGVIYERTIEKDIQERTYTDSVKQTKDELYRSTLIWATKYNLDLSSSIQIENLNAGLISIQYRKRVIVGFSFYDCSFIQNVNFRDGELRNTFIIMRNENGFPFRDTYADLGFTFAALHASLVSSLR